MEGKKGIAVGGIVAFVIFSLALSPVMSLIQTNVTVSSYGSVSASTEIVYTTGFENAKTDPRGWFLDLDPDPQYGYPLSNFISRLEPNEGKQWIEGFESRPSGVTFPANFAQRPGSNRCLGLYWPPGTARSTFSMWTVPWAGAPSQPNLTGDGFYISEWLFIPSFVLGSTTDQWYGLFQISNAGGDVYPYYQFVILGHTSHPQVPAGTYAAVLDHRAANGAESYLATYQNFQNVLPIGRWFKFEWYMVRHATNGIIKCWVDGVQIFDMSGLNTTTPGTTAYPNAYTCDVAKIYLQSNDPNAHWLFLDDVTIWNTLPSA